jgi:cell division transport system ATP-binding protein
VDNEIAMRLIYLFDELNKMGTTVIIATHNKDLVSRFSHPVIRLEDGEASVVDQLEKVCA